MECSAKNGENINEIMIQLQIALEEKYSKASESEVPLEQATDGTKLGTNAKEPKKKSDCKC